LPFAIELEVRVGVVSHKSGTHELWWIWQCINQTCQTW
jgi:hypothetical protein